MGKKKLRYFTYVHINTLAQQPTSVITAPQVQMVQPVPAQLALDSSQTVEIEVGGKKLRGRILKILENEKLVLFLDENNKLHVIHLSKLKSASSTPLIPMLA